MKIIDDSREFYEKLSEILSEIDYNNIEGWFQSKLKPILYLDNNNFIAVHLTVNRLAKENNSLRKICELIYLNSQKNEDTKFISEYVRFAQNGDFISNDLINAVTSVIESNGNPSGGAILKLHRLYSGPDPPNVSYLRSADVIGNIVENTFGSGRVAQKDKKLWLIAYAAYWNTTETCAQDINEGNIALTKLHELFDRNKSMSNLVDSLKTFLEVLEEPICATAMVIWLKKKLFDDDFYEWTALTQGEVPAAFHILDEIAIVHISHRSKVLDIYISLFEREFKILESKQISVVMIKYREKFLDHIVLLFHLCMERQVLNYFGSRADSIDSSLIIYFLEKIIPNLEMPIDPEMYGLIIKTLRSAPAQSISSSMAVKKLLQSGDHLSLSGEDSTLHNQLQALLI